MSIFLVPLFHDGPALFISFTQKNAAEPAETWGEMQGLYCTWIPCYVALSVFRSTSVEKVDDELVSGHDDGGVWDLSDEVRAETPVEPPVPLFLEDCY